MAKTTAEWRVIFSDKNARRKNVDRSERLFNRKMGRALSLKQWDKSTNSVRVP